MSSYTTIDDPDLFLTFTSRASQSLHATTGDFMSFYQRPFMLTNENSRVKGILAPKLSLWIPLYELLNNSRTLCHFNRPSRGRLHFQPNIHTIWGELMSDPATGSNVCMQTKVSGFEILNVSFLPPYTCAFLGVNTGIIRATWSSCCQSAEVNKFIKDPRQHCLSASVKSACCLQQKQHLRNSHRIPSCPSDPCARSSKPPSGDHTAWNMWKNAFGT